MERFWSKVNKTPGQGPNGDCWEWTGARSKRGYGKFKIGKIQKTASRVAYMLEVDNLELDSNIFVMHSCDNPPCCNPAHLSLGTHKENMEDMKLKGRSHKELLSLRRDIPEGYSYCYDCKELLVLSLFDRSNKLWTGVRGVCKECSRKQARALYARKKEKGLIKSKTGEKAKRKLTKKLFTLLALTSLPKYYPFNLTT